MCFVDGKTKRGQGKEIKKKEQSVFVTKNVQCTLTEERERISGIVRDVEGERKREKANE